MRTAALWLCGLAAAGTACVSSTSEEDLRGALPPPPPTQSVVLPLGGAPGALDQPVDQYYASLVGQMREALKERQLEPLRSLLLTCDRRDAPPWVRNQMDGFKSAIDGLAVAEHCAQHGTLSVDASAQYVGDPLGFAIEVPSAAALGNDVVLGVEGETPVTFRVGVVITDRDALGAESKRETTELLKLRQPCALDREALRLPFAVDGGGPSAVVRTVEVAAEVLQGMATVDGHACPLPRTFVHRGSWTFYPRGVEPIRTQPMRTLRNALALGDAAHFAHLYLATLFLPGEDRDAAAALLVERVRLGNPGQARSAMACLSVATGEDFGSDRDAWLRWWQER